MADRSQITNTQARLITLPRTASFPAAVLQPGVNFVDVKYLDELSALGNVGPGKTWLEWQRAGLIAVRREADVGATAGVAAPQDLSKHREDQAIAFVGAENDSAVLRRWRDAEKRPAVVSALDAKLGGEEPARKVTSKR